MGSGDEIPSGILKGGALKQGVQGIEAKRALRAMKRGADSGKRSVRTSGQSRAEKARLTEQESPAPPHACFFCARL